MSKFDLMIGWGLTIAESCVLFRMTDNGGRATPDEVQDAASRGTCRGPELGRATMHRLRRKLASRGINITTVRSVGYEIAPGGLDRINEAMAALDGIAWSRARNQFQPAQGV